MKKKVLSVAVCAAILSICFGLTACGGNKTVGDTYKGEVSQQTYATKEEAVQDFLAVELSGMATNAVYVNYEKKAELSQKEVDELKLSEEFTKDLKSVEKGEVEYAEESAGAYSASKKSAATVKREVYILTYPSTFRYFTPELKEGEVLTASYLRSVLQLEKYKNCSIDTTFKDSYLDEDGKKQTITYGDIVRNTETVHYETYTGVAVDDGYDKYWVISTSEGFYDAWLEDGKCDVAPYMWEEYGEINYAYEAIFEYFINRLPVLYIIDHTFLIKTKTGFTFSDDYYKLVEVDYESGQHECNFIVENGRFEEITYKFKYEDEENTMTMKFFDFGKTKVTIPAEVKKLLPQ